MNKQIKPVEVQRDTTGDWSHPDMPEFDEGDGAAYAAWVESQNIEVKHDWLEGYDLDHPAYVQYFDKEDGFAAWEPRQPEGDGWFLIAIGDTEDGPCAWFARHK